MTAYPFDCCQHCGHALWPSDTLTPRQREVLLAIQDYYDAHGYPPTYDEIMDATGLASKSNVHWLITRLVERHYLYRTPSRARSIEILRRVPVPDAPRKRRAG